MNGSAHAPLSIIAPSILPGNRFLWSPFLSRLARISALSHTTRLATLETKRCILKKLRARMKQETCPCP
jgi:hypothetical protein